MMSNTNVFEFPDGSQKKQVKIGKWDVSIDGEMVHDLSHRIYPAMLTQDDLILHMSAKTWFESSDFFPAFFQALVNAEVQKVEIKAFY